jgi:PPOX class probable FMN-dependent enzyme
MPMNAQADPHAITSLPQLEALFGAVGEASLKKEVDYLHSAYQALIQASPFAVLATAGPGGLDASPRGDPSGFVAIQDDRTLLLPERRGNNRIDSLRNLLADPRVALLFLIPGAGETLRVNGSARITVAPDVLQRFSMEGKLPHCVIVIHVESVFFQCARAIQRSKLWQATPPGRPDVPTPGAMLQALTAAAIDGAQYDRELPARQKSTLY